jgi:hypothetical protein
MAAWKQAGCWAAVILGAGLCSGCNIMALPFFLIPGMDPKHDAKCKLASDDKDKEVKVVLLASAGLEIRPEFLRVDRELSHLIAAQLREAFKKNEEKVTVVPISKVEKYKDEHPNWHSLEPEEIGKYFNADYVIDIEIDSLSLYEPGSSNTLYRGRAAISIAVINTHQSVDGPIYKEEYTCEYPRARGPIPTNDGNAVQFRQAFLNVVAREIAWRFTSHPVEDDFKCD